MSSTIFIPASFRNHLDARRRFSEIVQWAQAHHPFYQSWLAQSDKKVPILSRQVVQQNNEALLNGHPVTMRTSGSTGMPVSIAHSPVRLNMELRDTELVVSWLGGYLPRSHIVRTDDKQDEQTLDIQTPVEQQLAFIQQRYKDAQAISLVTYPSNVQILCEAAQARGQTFPFMKRVICYAEAFEPVHEALINRVFPNAFVSSNYSSTEFGMTAVRCPHEPGYHHIMAHKLGVEVLDDDDQPCIEGEIGRIVITDFFNRAMPLIRYEIGDLGSPGLCPCNTIALPALSAVIGKTRGALKHKNGERVVFAELSARMNDIPGIRQYQVIQNTLEDFDVLIARNSGADISSIEKALQDTFNAHFGYNVQITLIERTHIPRGKNGKYYGSICKI